jgi:hypothetical protein
MLSGAVVYNAAVIGYIIDAHREWANESQVILFVAKVHLVAFLDSYIRTSSPLAWVTSSFLGGSRRVPRQCGGSSLVLRQVLL